MKMFSILAIFLTVTASFTAVASSSSMSVGPTSDGRYFYKQDGCNGFSNIINNVEGYKVQSSLGSDVQMTVCGHVDRLVGVNMLEVLKLVAPLLKDCLSIDVDEDAKVISIAGLAGLKQFTEVSETNRAYVMDGKVVFREPTDLEKRAYAFCVIGNGLEDQDPYNQFLR